MEIIILTPVRLLAEGLAGCLSPQKEITVEALVSDFGALRSALRSTTNLVLVDVTSGFDAEEVRSIAIDRPELVLIALGLREQRDEVVDCGRAGFTAYVPRDAGLEALQDAMLAAVAGRLTCSGEIASG